MSDIKFGTDGWRAVISDDFTFENVEKVAQAVADFIKSRKEPVYRKKKIAVGYDTRFLSRKYAELVSSVLTANGISVYLSDGPSPTPACCVYLKEKKLTGAVMITASHNPPEYNGIKYKGYFGGSAGNDIVEGIESYLGKNRIKKLDLGEAAKKKLIFEDDFVGSQLAAIKSYSDMRLLNKSKLKVLVDSMNGTGDRYLQKVLSRSGITLDFMYDEMNPSFGGRAPEPNEKNLKELMREVKKGGYDLGLATDGDSDRVAVVDEKGRLLSGHVLMALLLLHLLQGRNMRGGVVQTVCGTRKIESICERYSLKHYETPVGFKYICEIMTKKDILIGGEETGGVGFKNYIPERDGFLSALLIMELLATRGKKLSEIVSDMESEYGRDVYLREDLLFDASKRNKLLSGIKKRPLEEVLGKKVVKINDSDGTKFILDDGTWLLLRLSGTEPKLRIYSETPSRARSMKYLEYGKDYAARLLK